jgi:hypothetical protein
MSTEEIRDGFIRVTDVIGAFSGVLDVPREILDPAAERGSMTHAFIELILQGEDPQVVPEEIQGFLASFRDFWNRHSHTFQNAPIELEKRLYCESWKITGCVDAIIKAEDKTYLVDWKTCSSAHPLSWRLQGAAYKYLAEINGYKTIEDVMFVRLKKDGKTPALAKYASFMEDLGMFRNCLDVYQYFEIDKRKGWN